MCAPEMGARLQFGLQSDGARTLINNAQAHAVQAQKRPLHHHLALMGNIEGENASLVAGRLRVDDQIGRAHV